MMKRLFPLLLSFCIVLSAEFPTPAQESHEIVIKPKKYVATIAIPHFSRKAGSEDMKSGALSSVVYRDLELSGFFLRPQNEKFVAETNRSDQTAGKIDFAEWNRLGCSFLLKGEYSMTSSDFSVDCYLYDVKTGVRVFGKKFGDYPPSAWRRVAHQISDEVVRYVTHSQGVACSQIIYISRQGKGKDLYIMDADGADQRPLTRDQNLAATPCWGAGGAEVYYTSYREHNPDLWVLRLSDNQTGVISSHPGFNLSPAWCEKIGRIALTLSKDGNSELYSMDYRGKSLKRLTFDRAIDSSPSWSPDGRQIAFTSDRSGSPQIYIMDSEGMNVKRLTFQGSFNDSAEWSPLGDRIVFTSRKGGYFHIFLMNPDGSNWIQLTDGSSNNEDPTWAPNGRHLAFTSDRTGSPQIYMITDDASILAQLTKTGKNQSPSWSPILY